MTWLEGVLVGAALLAFVDRFVSRHAAALTLLVLVTLPWPTARLGHALSHEPFSAIVARVAYLLAPWVGLVPFALARGSSPARVALRLGCVCAFALETLFPSDAPLVTALVAGAIGTLLDELDRSGPDALLALGVLVVGALVAHDRPALLWPTAVATGTTVGVLLVERGWLPVRRSSAIAVVATAGGLFLRAKGH